MRRTTTPTTKWQDWASFVLALWLALSPWLSGYQEHESATANAVGIGIALALFAHFECVACERQPAEWLNLAAGIWLMWAPFALELTSDTASVNSLAVGTGVALLAVSSLSLGGHLGGRVWPRRASL